jgi:hypothetical protein
VVLGAYARSFKIVTVMWYVLLAWRKQDTIVGVVARPFIKKIVLVGI